MSEKKVFDFTGYKPPQANEEEEGEEEGKVFDFSGYDSKAVEKVEDKETTTETIIGEGGGSYKAPTAEEFDKALEADETGTILGALQNTLAEGETKWLTDYQRLFVTALAYVAPQIAGRQKGISREDAIKKVRKHYDELGVKKKYDDFLKTKDTTDEYIQKKRESNIYWEGALGLTESIGPMLTPGMSGFFISTFEDSYKELEDSDLSVEEKATYAAVQGSIAMTLERIGFRNLGASKSFMTSAVGKVFASAQKHFGKVTKNTIARVLLPTVTAFASEFETGAAQELSSQTTKHILNYLNDEELVEAQTGMDLFESVMHSGVVEGIGGKIMGIPKTIGVIASEANGKGKAKRRAEKVRIDKIKRDKNVPIAEIIKAVDTGTEKELNDEIDKLGYTYQLNEEVTDNEKKDLNSSKKIADETKKNIQKDIDEYKLLKESYSGIDNQNVREVFNNNKKIELIKKQISNLDMDISSNIPISEAFQAAIDELNSNNNILLGLEVADQQTDAEVADQQADVEVGVTSKEALRQARQAFDIAVQENEDVDEAFLRTQDFLEKEGIWNNANKGMQESVQAIIDKYQAAKGEDFDASVIKSREPVATQTTDDTKFDDTTIDVQQPQPTTKVKKEYQGKVIYSTPGTGKTTLVKELKEQGIEDVVDMDDILVEKTKKAFPKEKHITNESIGSRIADLYEKANRNGDQNAINALDQIYAESLAEGQALAKQGKTVLTGSKRFIGKTDVAVVSKDDSVMKDKLIDPKKIRRAEKRLESKKELEKDSFIGKEITETVSLEEQAKRDEAEAKRQEAVKKKQEADLKAEAEKQEADRRKKLPRAGKNVGKEVVYRGKKGILKKEGVRYVVEVGDTIHELAEAKDDSILEDYGVSLRKDKQAQADVSVENVTEKGATINGVDYDFILDDNGNIKALVPKKGKKTHITNEKLVIAAEIARNKMEIVEKANDPKLDKKLEEAKKDDPQVAILEGVLQKRYTETIDKSLEKLYKGEPLVKDEMFFVERWLDEAIDGVMRILESDPDSKVYENALNNLDIIADLINEQKEQNDKPQVSKKLSAKQRKQEKQAKKRKPKEKQKREGELDVSEEIPELYNKIRNIAKDEVGKKGQTESLFVGVTIQNMVKSGKISIEQARQLVELAKEKGTQIGYPSFSETQAQRTEEAIKEKEAESKEKVDKAAAESLSKTEEDIKAEEATKKAEETTKQKSPEELAKDIWKSVAGGVEIEITDPETGITKKIKPSKQGIPFINDKFAEDIIAEIIRIIRGDSSIPLIKAITVGIKKIYGNTKWNKLGKYKQEKVVEFLEKVMEATYKLERKKKSFVKTTKQEEVEVQNDLVEALGGEEFSNLTGDEQMTAQFSENYDATEFRRNKVRVLLEDVPGLQYGKAIDAIYDITRNSDKYNTIEEVLNDMIKNGTNEQKILASHLIPMPVGELVTLFNVYESIEKVPYMYIDENGGVKFANTDYYGTKKTMREQFDTAFESLGDAEFKNLLSYLRGGYESPTPGKSFRGAIELEKKFYGAKKRLQETKKKDPKNEKEIERQEHEATLLASELVELELRFLQRVTGIPMADWQQILEKERKKKGHKTYSETFLKSGRYNTALYRFVIEKLEDKNSLKDIMLGDKAKKIKGQLDVGLINAVLEKEGFKLKNHFNKSNFNNGTAFISNSYITERAKKVLEKVPNYLKNNPLIKQFQKENKESIQVYWLDGMKSAIKKEGEVSGKLTSNDFVSMNLALFMSPENAGSIFSKGKFLMPIEQFSDKKQFPTIEVSKLTVAKAKEQLEQMRKEFIAVPSEAEIDNSIKDMVKRINKMVQFGQIKIPQDADIKGIAERYVYNYTTHKPSIDQVFFGNTERNFSTKGKHDYTKQVKRAGSFLSNGMRINTKIEGGIGESTNYMLIDDVIIEELKAAGHIMKDVEITDGFTISFDFFNDKMQVSMGDLEQTKPLSKPIYVDINDETGNGVMIKTMGNPITRKFAEDEFKRTKNRKLLNMYEYAEKNNIGFITRPSSTKLRAGLKTNKIYQTRNENWRLQQNYNRPSEFKKQSLPKQMVRFAKRYKSGPQIEALFNKVILDKANKIITKLENLKGKAFKEYILNSIPNTEENADIRTLVAAGVAYGDPQIENMYKSIVRKIITKEVLDLHGNGGMLYSGFEVNQTLKKAKVVNGKVQPGEAMVPANSGLKVRRKDPKTGKIIPGDFFFPTRVPSTGPHSTPLVEAVAYTDEEMGNVIYLDEVSRAIAGEDMDGDARFVWALNSGDELSQEQKDINEAFELLKKEYLDPENFKDIMTPLNSDHLSEILEKKKKGEEQWNPYLPQALYNAYDNNSDGQRTIGIVARASAVYTYIRSYNMSLNLGISVPLPKPDGNITSKVIKTLANNTLVERIFGANTHETVDSAKMQNLVAMNHTYLKSPFHNALLVLMGSDPQYGKDEKSLHTAIIELMDDPTIKSYFEAIKDEESLNSSIDKKQLIEDMRTAAKQKKDTKRLEMIDFIEQINGLGSDLFVINNMISFVEKGISSYRDIKVVQGILQRLKNPGGLTYLNINGLAQSDTIKVLEANLKIAKIMYMGAEKNSTRLIEGTGVFSKIYNEIASRYNLKRTNKQDSKKIENAIKKYFYRDIIGSNGDIITLKNKLFPKINQLKNTGNAFIDALQVKKSNDYGDHLVMVDHMRSNFLDKAQLREMREAFDSLPNDIQNELVQYLYETDGLGKATVTGSYSQIVGIKKRQEIGNKVNEKMESWREATKATEKDIIQSAANLVDDVEQNFADNIIEQSKTTIKLPISKKRTEEIKNSKESQIINSENPLPSGDYNGVVVSSQELLDVTEAMAYGDLQKWADKSGFKIDVKKVREEIDLQANLKSFDEIVDSMTKRNGYPKDSWIYNFLSGDLEIEGTRSGKKIYIAQALSKENYVKETEKKQESGEQTATPKTDTIGKKIISDDDISSYNDYLKKSKGEKPKRFFTSKTKFKEFFQESTGKRLTAPPSSIWLLNKDGYYDLIDQETGEVYIYDVDLKTGKKVPTDPKLQKEPTKKDIQEGTRKFAKVPKLREDKAFSNKVFAHFSALFPGIEIFQNQEQFVQFIEKHYGAKINSFKSLGAAFANTIFIDPTSARQDTFFHEMAHLYWDALPDSDPVKKVLNKMFDGHEENIIQAISESGYTKAKAQLGSKFKLSTWEAILKNFWKRVKNMFPIRDEDHFTGIMANRMWDNVDQIDAASFVEKTLKLQQEQQQQDKESRAKTEKAIDYLNRRMDKYLRGRIVPLASITARDIVLMWEKFLPIGEEHEGKDLDELVYADKDFEVKKNERTEEYKPLTLREYGAKIGVPDTKEINEDSEFGKTIIGKYNKYRDSFIQVNDFLQEYTLEELVDMDISDINEHANNMLAEEDIASGGIRKLLNKILYAQILASQVRNENTAEFDGYKTWTNSLKDHYDDPMKAESFGVIDKKSWFDQVLMSPIYERAALMQSRTLLKNQTMHELQDITKRNREALELKEKEAKKVGVKNSDYKQLIDKKLLEEKEKMYFIDEDSDVYKKMKNGTPKEQALISWLDTYMEITEKYAHKYDKFQNEHHAKRTRIVPTVAADWMGLVLSSRKRGIGLWDIVKLKNIKNLGAIDNISLDSSALGGTFTLREAKQELLKRAENGLIEKVKALYHISRLEDKAKRLYQKAYENVDSRTRAQRIETDASGAVIYVKPKRISSSRGSIDVKFASSNITSAAINYHQQLIFKQKMNSLLPVLEFYKMHSSEKNNIELVKYFEKHDRREVYGEMLPSYLPTPLAKTLRWLITYTALKYLAVNVWGATGNLTAGLVSNFNRHGPKHMITGMARFFTKFHITVLDGDKGFWEKYDNAFVVSKGLQMLRKLGLVEISEDTRLSESQLVQSRTNNTLFVLISIVENFVQGITIFGLMTDQEWASYDKNFDLITKETHPKEYARFKKEFGDKAEPKGITSRRRSFFVAETSRTHGAYHNMVRRLSSATPEGASLLQFVGWLPEYAASYLERNNMELSDAFGTVQKGTIHTSLNAKMWKAIISKSQREELSDVDRRNMERLARSAISFSFFAIMAAVVSNDEDLERWVWARLKDFMGIWNQIYQIKQGKIPTPFSSAPGDLIDAIIDYTSEGDPEKLINSIPGVRNLPESTKDELYDILEF